MSQHSHNYLVIKNTLTIRIDPLKSIFKFKDGTSVSLSFEHSQYVYLCMDIII